MLWATVVLAWYAARAESRAVRLLAGTPRWRIQTQDMVGWLRVVLPVAFIGILCTGIAVGLTRGVSNGLLVGGVVAGYLMGLVIIAMLFAIVASLITAPSVSSLALRKPPESRFEFPSQLLKAVALALGLAALPAMLWQVSSSLRQADVQGRVVVLKDYVAQAVGGVSNSEFQSRIIELDKFVAAVDSADSVAYAEIANREDPGPAFAKAGFDSVAIINSHYAKLFGLTLDNGSLEPVDTQEVEHLLTSLEGSRYGGLRSWFRLSEATAEENGLIGYRLTSGTGIVVPTGSGLGFRHAENPLVLISERISASLDDDALAGAGLSGGHVMFRDPQLLDETARETGVSHLLTSRTRVTDSALLAAQFANQVVLTVSASIVVLLSAIAVSGWLSARVYSSNNARFIYPMLTYGRNWWVVLKRRVLTEIIIITFTFALVSAIYLSLGLSWSPMLMVGVIIYLGYSAWCHQRAALSMIHRVTQRAH